MAATTRVLRITSRRFAGVFRHSSIICAPVSSVAFTQNTLLQSQKHVTLKCTVLSAPIRWYGSEAATMTEADLTNRVVNVVKMFDKVTPDKVK